MDEQAEPTGKDGKKAPRTKAAKKAADDKPAEAEQGRTTRTRAAARRAEAEKEQKGKDKEVAEAAEGKKPKKTAAGKKKREAEPATPTADDTAATSAEAEAAQVVVVQQVMETVEEVVRVVVREDVELAVEWAAVEQQSSLSTSTSITATEVDVDALLVDEALDSEPLAKPQPVKKTAEYPTLSTIMPPFVPSTPLSPVSSPTSAFAAQSASDDRPADAAKPAGWSWLKAPFSMLGIGGGASAAKKEALTLASVTPGAMLAPALRSSPATTPASSPAPSPSSSPSASPASSPVLQPVSAPIASLPPLTAALPPPLPTTTPAASVESAAAASAKSRKEELKAKLEASKQQMKDKIEEARALGSSGSNTSAGSHTTSPSTTPLAADAAPSSMSLGGDRQGSVQAVVSRHTAEHIQVIDIVESVEGRATVSAAAESSVVDTHAERPAQRDDGSHFVVAAETAVNLIEPQHTTSTTSAMDITLLSAHSDVTQVEPDESSSQDMADVTMTDDGEARRDERAESSGKAKGGKAETSKKKDAKEKALEAARKREEVEKRRRQLEEAERRKLEEKEEERRKKEEQAKKTKQQQATDKKKAAATLKPTTTATTTSTHIASTTKTATLKGKAEKAALAKTLPLPLTWQAGGGSAARSATLPEPLTIVELGGSSVSYTAGSEWKEGKEETWAADEDEEAKYADEEEKEAVALSSYAPPPSQPTQHPHLYGAPSYTNPPPLPPLPSAAAKAMPPPPPLPAKLQGAAPQLVKFHMPAPSHVTSDAQLTAAPSVMPPPKPYHILPSAGQPTAADAMLPPPARLPHNKTPPHAQTSGVHPPPVPAQYTPEHGKLLPPSPAFPPSASSSHTPSQPKSKPSPQSYVFTPPPKPLVSADANNYPLSDHERSDDEDDEDDNSAAKRRAARIPSWAKEPNLSHALRAQQAAAVDPDSIFPPIDPFSMSLAEIFKGFKRTKRIRERTSSGNWQMDALSVREDMQYKRDMGYVRHGEVTAVSAAIHGSPGVLSG